MHCEWLLQSLTESFIDRISYWTNWHWISPYLNSRRAIIYTHIQCCHPFSPLTLQTFHSSAVAAAVCNAERNLIGQMNCAIEQQCSMQIAQLAQNYPLWAVTGKVVALFHDIKRLKLSRSPLMHLFSVLSMNINRFFTSTKTEWTFFGWTKSSVTFILFARFAQRFFNISHSKYSCSSRHCEFWKSQ